MTIPTHPGAALLRILVVSAAVLSSAPLTAQEWLDRVDDSLFVESPHGFVRTDLSGRLDFEGYTIDQNPPGLLFGDHDFLFNPRLSLFLDTTLGRHFYSLVQVRADRGFDPGVFPDGDIRVDEYLVRYTPFEDARLNLQVGKFATHFGNWISRHDSWNNPFITAPLPYENVTIVSDGAVPGGPAAFLDRKNVPDKKANWLPVIWGPSYASGAAVLGLVDRFEYAFEVKNAGLASRPAAWDGTDRTWENPTVTGRVGYRPNATWNIGASASYGAYHLDLAEPALPAGTGLGDFNQIAIGQDVRYAWRHWQVWAEVVLNRWEVPNVGNADSAAYYLEAKYKFTPHWFGAWRWNQQFFGKVDNGLGGRTPWDRDIWRIDSALGYRWNLHWQTKLQYSFSHQKGVWQQGEQLLALQLTARF